MDKLIDAEGLAIDLIHSMDYCDDILEIVERQPEAIVRCKDCKYFEYNSVAKVDGIPLIVAHEICQRWGAGCKTWEDGFCFLAERSEDGNS